MSFFKEIYSFYVYGCFAYVHVCAPCACCVSGGQKRGSDPQGWSYRQLRAAVWVLGMNPGPLEERPVLLIAEPSLQPQILASYSIEKNTVFEQCKLH